MPPDHRLWILVSGGNCFHFPLAVVVDVVVAVVLVAVDDVRVEFVVVVVGSDVPVDVVAG